MIDSQRISEAEKNVQQYLQDGLLFTKRKDIVQFSPFFLKNAETSLLTAKVLFDISIDFDQAGTVTATIQECP